jgi:predicted Ser/Thr protein kinase
MTTDADPPEATPETPSDDLGSLDPGELLARALHTPQPTIGQGPWVPPEPEELARLLPQYRIERLLGHGGMGAVYQGEQTALQRKVAIKLLPADLAMDAQFVARFQREARMLARLQHPGIVAVYDCGQSSAGHLYFVMEYVDGTDLQRVLRDPGLDPEQAMELITQICDALHYAHRQGVIHRDIKPANILLGIDGRVKVADFGLARPNEVEGDDLTRTNMVMGTPAYMAPEQRMGQADQRADIFALGVMLYEMLTGQRPHGAFDPPSHKVQVDVRIDSVVLKALQSEPERRYQQVSEMWSDVHDIRTTPLPAVPPPPPAPAGRNWKWPVSVAASVVVLALGWFFLSPRGQALWRPAAHTRAEAEQGTPDGSGAAAAAKPGEQAQVAATPPPVSEADRAPLEAALFEADWQFDTPNPNGTYSYYQLHFEKDHIVRTNRGAGAAWHWWITGPRSVHMQMANEPEQYDPHRGTNLIFYTSLKRFDGLSLVGDGRQSGEQIARAPATPASKPIAAAPTPPPATPAPATPAPATPAPIAFSATPKPTAIGPWPARGEPMSIAGMLQVADIQFARGLYGFPQTDDQRWKLGLVNGEYQMLCRESGVWWPAQPLQNLRVNEFVCEVRARVFQNAVGGWGLGIIGGDGDDHTWVGVQVDGAAMLNSHTFAKDGVEWPWQYSPAMKRGAEANTIRIEATGQRVRVFANGVFVFERLHQKMRPNSNLALFCFGKQPPEDVRILSVQVWAPTALSGLALEKARAMAASTPAAAPSSPFPSTPAPLLVRSTPAGAQPVDLFSAANIGAWQGIGGTLRTELGCWTTQRAQTGHGVVWYTKRPYANFTLRLEFMTESPKSNSGVFVRSPTQVADPNGTRDGYEIQILGDLKDPQPTGAIYSNAPPSSVPQKGGWNTMEITVVKQDYTVTVNGVVTNRFVGKGALSGYLGLQCHHAGAVKFRNVRITDLSGGAR